MPRRWHTNHANLREKTCSILSIRFIYKALNLTCTFWIKLIRIRFVCLLMLVNELSLLCEGRAYSGGRYGLLVLYTSPDTRRKVYAPQSVPSYSDMQVCVHTSTTEARNLLIKRAFSFYSGGIVTLGNFGVSINRMIFCHAPFPFHSSNNIVRRTE